MNKTAKNSMIYLCGTVTMALLGFASTMLLTRVLSQKVYAMYGLLSTFTSAVVTFVCVGHDASYMRFFYDHGAAKRTFLSRSLRVPIILTGLFGLIALEPAHWLMNTVFGTTLSTVSIVMIVIYILAGVFHKFTQVAVRMESRAANYVISHISSKMGLLVIILIFSCCVQQVLFSQVVAAFVLSSISALLINLCVVRTLRDEPHHMAVFTPHKELFAYGLPYMLNNFLMLVIPLAEKMILREMAGWELLGLFTAASVFQTVVFLVVSTVDNIWNPLVYKEYGNPERFKPIMHYFGLFTILLTGLGLAACILLRRWLVVLLDESYCEVYIIAPAIMLGAFFNVITLVYGVGINIEKKTVHHIVCPVIQFAVSTVLYVLLIPHMGLVGIGMANLVSIAVSRVYKIVIGLRYYDTGCAEARSIALCIIYVFAAMLSMFQLSLAADIVTCVSLIGVMVLICANEISSLVGVIMRYFKPKREA